MKPDVCQVIRLDFLNYALVALLLAGCGKTYWTHPTADAAQLKRDHYECARDSQTYYVGGSGFYGGFAAGYAKRQADDLYDLCMESKGWEKRRSD